jgi:hypothetical protein
MVYSAAGPPTSDRVIVMFEHLMYFYCVEGTDQDKHTLQLMLLKGRVSGENYVHTSKENFMEEVISFALTSQ